MGTRALSVAELKDPRRKRRSIWAVKILRLESADIVRKLSHDQFDETWHLNLDCVAYLQEVHHRPTANNPNPVETWHVAVGAGAGGVTLSVTKNAFERIRQAMESAGS